MTQASLAAPGASLAGASTGANGGSGAAAEPPEGKSWGNKEGTEEDKGVLNDIIKAELQKPGNKGKFILDFTMINDSCISKAWMRILQRLLTGDFSTPT